MIDEDGTQLGILNIKEAIELMNMSNTLNLVGEEAIKIANKERIGASEAVKKIGKVPFLMVFQ